MPTFLVGQFNDEQTGGHFGESLKYLAHNPNVWISMQNGVHADSLGPTTITRWAEFLKIYIANEVPAIPQPVIDLSGALYALLADAPAAPVLQSRFAGMTDVAAVKAAFKRDPRVRLLMDNGGGPWGAGSIGSPWELDFSAWPPKEAKATRLFLGKGGALGSKPSAGSAQLHGRPEGAPAPDAARRRRRGCLEGPAALQLGAARGRQGPRLGHRPD